MCIVTHTLAKNLALLYSKGYGNCAETLGEDQGVSQNATGTGMGEGVGANDVSDQITDEDQLLGDSSKVKTDTTFSNQYLEIVFIYTSKKYLFIPWHLYVGVTVG